MPLIDTRTPNPKSFIKGQPGRESQMSVRLEKRLQPFLGQIDDIG